MATPNQANLAVYLKALRESAIGPWEPLSKAAGVADGFANRVVRAHVYRNERPAEAREQLAAAFATWPILCRVMAELEAAFPEQADRGAADAAPILEVLDCRDRKGDYA